MAEHRAAPRLRFSARLKEDKQHIKIKTQKAKVGLETRTNRQSAIGNRQSSEGFPLGFWYAALPSVELKRGQMKRQLLLNRPLLLLRNKLDQVFALDDHCPHRGIPLSDGSFDGERVECCYHGWIFDCAGKCVHIPALLEDSPVKVERIKTKSFHCEEADGLVWVFMPSSNSKEISEAPRLAKFSDKFQISVLSSPLKCDMDHGIIGLMDPAHGPFVHQSWWWRNRKSIHEKAKRFEPIPNGFRMSAHTPSTNSAAYKLLNIYKEPITTTIDFILPNRRLEQVRCGPYWFSSQAVVTPITENECRLDFVAAWNILRGIPFIKSIYRFFAKQFIGQDQRIMEKQSIGLCDNPTLMLIDDADTQAKWYYQLKAAYLKAQTNGGEMEHPLKEAVTLRWRS
jgi:phenylpropionate dioxygenase-like ring-hydroxylating dioxygenase large terminal subunit